MSEISFHIVGARPEPYAAVPTIDFRLRAEGPRAQTVQSVILHCQIRIEPRRRRYSEPEQQRLVELFGETPRWGDTLKPFFWTTASTVIAGFTGATETDLPVACSYDLEVAAAKYLHSLDDDDIPLLFLFSGTAFEKGPSGFMISPVSWNQEASYRLPVRVWRELMDCYFPHSGWLRLRRETLDALARVKASNAITTWDGVIESLLQAAGGRQA